ncbi:uncharacterized protein LOC129757405 [Uranotaenia lowii]|uniref:uncharacterized protein LOC129757405 n=1 Tax=Uranotaenia lowii TaxID=190385 RepID=UPI00247A1E3E|nr:uncharacterized protein LOC129757405 [Uranotaenia lowii]
MEAEFCKLGEDKNELLLDRIVGGIKDEQLRLRLLNEAELNIEKAENIIMTWEMAKNCASAMEQPSPSGGLVGAVRGAVRRPVRERLGYRPYSGDREKFNKNPGGYSSRENFGDNRPSAGKTRRGFNKPDYSKIKCGFCGILGHPTRKCFAMKNMKRNAIKYVDAQQEDKAGKALSDLMARMRTSQSNSDSDSDSDLVWKRAPACSPESN